MNVFALILILLIVTILVGGLVFVIVRQTFAIKSSQSSISDLNTSVAGMKGDILSDATVSDGRMILLGRAVAANQTQLDLDSVAAQAQLTQFENNLKLDVVSQRVSIKTPTVGAPLSLSTTAPSTASTSAPTDSTKWLQVTDRDSVKYANVAVGSLWTDTGVSISKGACVDFGNGISMCGDQGHVRILGALEVCDSSGASCVPYGPKAAAAAATA